MSHGIDDRQACQNCAGCPQIWDTGIFEAAKEHPCHLFCYSRCKPAQEPADSIQLSKSPLLVLQGTSLLGASRELFIPPSFAELFSLRQV